MTYALDSNIISYMIRKDQGVCGRYLDESAAGHECIVPPVVYLFKDYIVRMCGT